MEEKAFNMYIANFYFLCPNFVADVNYFSSNKVYRYLDLVVVGLYFEGVRSRD